ncbi:MAG: glycoside hydrolase family protein [Deltaproteobacteria bacterium]|nr:glycoside hydrolase family protein [Deltaproteobacteria bacterium]
MPRWLAFLALALLGSVRVASAKSLIDYFQPTPIVSPLSSSTWGGSGVLPRDTSNGLETPDKKYFYWDGKILKVDGKYHLHCSRWPKSAGFNQWSTSIAVHATSDNVLGPYLDQGQIYDRNGGKGHNVATLALPDGSFTLYTSDITPGDFYTAPAITGPWTFKGSIEINKNGYDIPWPTSNITVMVRPNNGDFLATERSGFIYVGGSELLGPYEVKGPSVWPNVSGLDNSRAEDPVLWYSGGCYHITVNWWDSRVAHHLMSKDGVSDWKDMGVAYDPRTSFIRYTDGTVNKWNNLERPNVVIENGHVTHFTFAATDIDKSSITGTDNHGSKILVVPFDGVAFDADNGCESGTGGAGGGGASGRGGSSGAASSGGSGGSPRSDAGATGGTAGSRDGGRGDVGNGSGGSSATGGKAATGGKSGTGDTPATGGATATGGPAGAGGASGSGGVSPSGGKLASGGAAGAGGEPVTGGATSSAGGVRGASSSAGLGSGGATTSSGASSSSSNGCSCGMTAATGSRGAWPWLLLGWLLGLGARRPLTGARLLRGLAKAAGSSAADARQSETHRQ